MKQKPKCKIEETLGNHRGWTGVIPFLFVSVIFFLFIFDFLFDFFIDPLVVPVAYCLVSTHVDFQIVF